MALFGGNGRHRVNLKLGEIYGKSQKIPIRITDCRNGEKVDFYSFVKMKYAIIALLLLSGCRITPRYHQRGFSIDWHIVKNQVHFVADKSPSKRNSGLLDLNQSKDGNTESDYGQFYVASNQEKPQLQLENSTLGSPPWKFLELPHSKDSGAVQLFADPLTTQWMSGRTRTLEKRSDREVRLESAAMLCYAVGLVLVLISWYLANELVFLIGSLILLAGLMCVLVMGMSNIRHAFNGYMSIFTILGVLAVLWKLGYLDDLLSAWKP